MKTSKVKVTRTTYLSAWACKRDLKPNSITLSGSNQLRTGSEPASVMEFGFYTSKTKFPKRYPMSDHHTASADQSAVFSQTRDPVWCQFTFRHNRLPLTSCINRCCSRWRFEPDILIHCCVSEFHVGLRTVHWRTQYFILGYKFTKFKPVTAYDISKKRVVMQV